MNGLRAAWSVTLCIRTVSARPRLRVPTSNASRVMLTLMAIYVPCGDRRASVWIGLLFHSRAKACAGRPRTVSKVNNTA